MGKRESLAALAQSMFISGSALFLFLTGIQHLIRPEPMQGGGRRDGGDADRLDKHPDAGDLSALGGQKKTQSRAVRADMLHYQSDVMMNGAILIALGLSPVRLAPRRCAVCIRGLASIFLYSALRMGYDAVQSLLDRALPDEERQGNHQYREQLARRQRRARSTNAAVRADSLYSNTFGNGR